MLLDALENEVLAWEALHDPQRGGSLTALELYDLCLRAGYSKRAAERAMLDRWNARARNDLPP